MLNPYFKSQDKSFYLLHGDTMELLSQFHRKFDMVFADPPYFLSNGGLTINNGEIVSVNKGDWDKSKGIVFVNDFNRQELGFKILNIITWEKTNPPPNFSCKYFTHSTEQIIWARKEEKTPHYFNYELMKELNSNKQMKDVWRFSAIAPWEKSCGKHPTQKPLSVLTRLILASTQPDAWILDPFTGSSTTGIAANLQGRKFVGIDKEQEFLELSRRRKLEIENTDIFRKYKNRL